MCGETCSRSISDSRLMLLTRIRLGNPRNCLRPSEYGEYSDSPGCIQRNTKDSRARRGAQLSPRCVNIDLMDLGFVSLEYYTQYTLRPARW